MAGISGESAALPITQVVPFERTITGALGYNFDIPRVLDLIATGRLDPSPMLTDVRPLTEAVRTFDELNGGGDHMKILLTPKER